MKQYIKQEQQLIKLQGNADLERAHMQADDILLEILSDLGLDDIVKQYKAIDKWYA